MSFPRPLTKALLKRMFLQALLARRSAPADGVVRSDIPERFSLRSLTTVELGLGFRAVYELERDGLIMRDPTQSNEFKVLTDEGRALAAQEVTDVDPLAVNLDALIGRADLRDKVRDDYIAGDYDSAVFKAFKLVEETVRKKTGQPAALVGVGLMTAAFKAGGVLHHPEAQVDAEKEGLHQLFRGAIGWFKNPTSHRTVGYADARQAAHILAFANLLLDLVDQCRT